MSEFDKWWERYITSMFEHGGVLDGSSLDMVAELSWRAALKWVLEQDYGLNSPELAQIIYKECVKEDNLIIKTKNGKT